MPTRELLTPETRGEKIMGVLIIILICAAVVSIDYWMNAR